MIDHAKAAADMLRKEREKAAEAATKVAALLASSVQIAAHNTGGDGSRRMASKTAWPCSPHVPRTRGKRKNRAERIAARLAREVTTNG